jgi:hypothetical protein
MFIRVVYTTREAGIFTNSRGEMNLTFDKDIDWSEPVFMILEPAEMLEEKLPVVEGRLSYDPNVPDGLSVREAEDALLKKKLEKEAKRPVYQWGDYEFDYRESSMTEKAWDELADKEAYEKLLRDKVELEAKRPVLNNKDRPK